MYLAYTAPHWPIQAPAEDVDRYRQRYAQGWDVLREERFERMRAMGLTDGGWAMSGRDGPAWDTIDPAKQQEMALRMAIYAAMVDRMDQNIGRVVAQLESMGELEVRGPWIASSYHNSPEADDRWTDDGWPEAVDVRLADPEGQDPRERRARRERRPS